MKHILLTSLLGLSALTAAAQSNTIWFDEPTSLKGSQCWWGGHPEKYNKTHKPINAGEGAQNADPEWERRSLPLGNGSIGCNVMGSVATERYTLNEKTLCAVDRTRQKDRPTTGTKTNSRRTCCPKYVRLSSTATSTRPDD